MKDYNKPFLCCLPARLSPCYIGSIMTHAPFSSVGLHWGDQSWSAAGCAASGVHRQLWLPPAGSNCRERLLEVQHAVGHPLPALVIAVPTHFVDLERQAIYEASVALGLPLKRILNAPTAAALACRPRLPDGTLILALDLAATHFGGALLRLAAQPEILATGHGSRPAAQPSIIPLVQPILHRQAKPEALVLSGTWAQEPLALGQVTDRIGLAPDPGHDPLFAAACGAALQGFFLCKRPA